MAWRRAPRRGEEEEGDGDGNHSSLYSGLTTGEILHSLVNLHLLDSDSVIDLGMRVLGSPRIMGHTLVRGPVLRAIRALPFSHFCGGESLSEASATLSRLWLRLGLQGILNFALEDSPDDASCDANLHTFLDTIRHTRELPNESVK